MSLTHLLIVAVCTAGSAQGTGQAQQAPVQEQWVNPGVAVPPPTDLSIYVKRLDGAMVGTLERVSRVFLDESDPTTLHTVLTFRVNEWLFGALPQMTEGEIDVLMHGGTFVEQDGKRIPRRPADFARGLSVGAEYFVPIQDGGRFGKAGRLMVGSSIAMSRVERGTVTPVVQNMTWADQVVAQARKASAVPGPTPSAREVLLEAIRRAGPAK